MVRKIRVVQELLSEGRNSRTYRAGRMYQAIFVRYSRCSVYAFVKLVMIMMNKQWGGVF